MKTALTIPVICAVLGLSSCASSAGSNTTPGKVIVTQMFEAFNRHDSAALAKFYSDDAIVITPEKCEPTIGRDAIIANYQEMFAQIPDVTDTVNMLVEEDDVIAVAFTASSLIEGAEFELPISAFLTIKDGLIVRDDVYFDTDMTPDCSESSALPN